MLESFFETGTFHNFHYSWLQSGILLVQQDPPKSQSLLPRRLRPQDLEISLDVEQHSCCHQHIKKLLNLNIPVAWFTSCSKVNEGSRLWA